jgi:hypothetical protein
VFDVTCDEVHIEASNDDFATLEWSATASGEGIVPVPDVTAAKWRVRTGSAGEVGLLYLGRLIGVPNPGFPFGFEESVIADDRKTLAGTGFSKVYGTERTGKWVWEGLTAAEVKLFREWYGVTYGFRLPACIDNLGVGLRLVRAPSPFPFSRDNVNYYTGQIEAREVR